MAFALGQLLLCRNQATEYFDNLSFAIDRFHFPNHVDANCHEKFDPSTKPELKNVNTEICEQMFKGVNQYKNCRAMSEPTFKHFFRYNMDIHNLDIEGFANTLSNPHVQYRKDSVKVKDVAFNLLQKKTKLTVNIEEVASQIENLKMNPFNCSLCMCGYNTEVQLKKHMTQKHPETHHSNPRECPECGVICASDQRLKSHMVTHLRCSTECPITQEVLELHSV